MTVLITGGMGFIGLHTVEAFLDAGDDVVATYRETWRLPSFLELHVGKRLTFEQADIGEPGTLLGLAKKHGVDGIVHMAIHGQSEQDAGADLRINMDKLSTLLDAARDAGVRRPEPRQLQRTILRRGRGSLSRGPTTAHRLGDLARGVQEGVGGADAQLCKDVRHRPGQHAIERRVWPDVRFDA